MRQSNQGGSSSSPTHFYVDNAAYFITAATYRHQRLLDDELKDQLRDLLQVGRELEGESVCSVQLSVSPSSGQDRLLRPVDPRHGFVETDLTARYLNGPAGDPIRAQSPLGRVARPEEVAAAVLFLAADGSEFCTGAIIDVNGASYLRT